MLHPPMLPTEWTLATFVFPPLLLQHKPQAKMSNLISQSMLGALKCGKHIHAPGRMHPIYSADPVTFALAPPSGQNIWLAGNISKQTNCSIQSALMLPSERTLLVKYSAIRRWRPAEGLHYCFHYLTVFAETKCAVQVILKEFQLGSKCRSHQLEKMWGRK